MAERREKCLRIRYLSLFAVKEGGSRSDWMASSCGMERHGSGRASLTKDFVGVGIVVVVVVVLVVAVLVVWSRKECGSGSTRDLLLHPDHLLVQGFVQ